MIALLVAASVALSSPMAQAAHHERAFLTCVKIHESRGDYKAQNTTSTASGAYQFITATWLGNAKWAMWKGTYPARGYKKARHAPKWIQDLVALHAIRQEGGFRHWHGTGCRYKGVMA